MARAVTPSPSRDPGQRPADDGGERTPHVALAAALVLIVLVLVQCLVPITAQNLWDTDPRSRAGSAPLTELQPGQFAWLNTAVVLVAAAALWAHARSGGRLDRWVLTLGAAGVAACLMHLRGDVADLTRCGAWIGAATAGVAMAHLAQHAHVRRWLTAALVALALPLAVMAVWYVAVDHPITVRMFNATREQFLRDRGWAPDSTLAALYERRLNNPQFTGPLAMSNVTGSLGAALCVASLAVTVACWRARHRGLATLASVAALGAAVVAVLAKSKGAVAAAALVGAVLLASGLWRGAGRRRAGAMRVAALLLLAAPIVAVVIRGVAWQPGGRGELSLLVRYLYWEAVPRLLRDAPVAVWPAGIGPEGFRVANLRLKNPVNPEDVISLHQVFLDWTITLGIGGVAWSALTLLLLCRAAGHLMAPHSVAANAQPIELRRADVYTAAAVALTAFVTQYWVRLELQYAETSLLWLASTLVFAAVLALLASRGAWSVQGDRLALFAAAAVLLTHAQIEMTWFHHGSSALAWLIVGAAGALPWSMRRNDPHVDSSQGHAHAGPIARRMHNARHTRDTWQWPAVGACAALAVAMAVMYAVPLQRHDAALADAASQWRSDKDFRQVDAAFDRALGVLPRDPTTTRAAVSLWVQVAEAALHQGNRALHAESLANAERYLDRAAQAAGNRDDLRLLRARLAIIDSRGLAAGDAKPQSELVDVLRRVLTGAPYGLPDQLLLADVLWGLNRTDEARAAYARAQTLHEWNYLDPARQLQPDDMARVRSRAARP